MRNIWLYRLTIAWFTFFTIVSLGSAVTAALTNVDWIELSWQSRFLVVVAIAVNWGNTMMAYISKVAAKVEDGESPITNGDTGLLTKADAAKPKA